MTRHELKIILLTLIGAAGFCGFFVLGAKSLVACFGCGLLMLIVLGARDLMERTHRLDGRTESLRQAADEMGFEFRDNVPFTELPWSNAFRLTEYGHQIQEALGDSHLLKWIPCGLPTIRNELRRDHGDVRLCFFDCEYIVRNSEDGAHHTVFVVQAPNLQRPWFGLFPASGWGYFANKFRENPIIRGTHRLEGEDLGWSAGIDQLVTWLDPDTHVEVGEGVMLVYCKKKLIHPTEIPGQIAIVMEIYDAVSAQAGGQVAATSVARDSDPVRCETR